MKQRMIIRQLSDGNKMMIICINRFPRKPCLEKSSVKCLESLVFRVFQLYTPHPDDPTRVDRVLVFVQTASYFHASPFFSHNHREAFSAASVAECTAFFLNAPSIPKLLKALNSERAAKPLQPTSTGRHLTLHPAC